MTAFSDLTLRHFSAADLVIPEAREQWPDDQTGAYSKPIGLWLSVEDPDAFGWTHWCEQEGCGYVGAHEHAVTIADGAHVLHIATPAELIAFHRQFGIEDRFNLKVSWSSVARDYQGVIITPYLWSMRLGSEVGWYYTWDCASGCIWDPAAIASCECVGRYIAPVDNDTDDDEPSQEQLDRWTERVYGSR